MVNFRMNWIKPRMFKASWVILIGFLSLFILDLYSTLRTGELLPLLEANPLYPYIGMWGISFLNILVVWLFLKSYHRGNPMSRFLVMSTFVYLTAIRAGVIINNFKIVKRIDAGELTIHNLEPLTQGEMIAHYSSTVSVIILLGIIYCFASYWLWSLDHKAVER